MKNLKIITTILFCLVVFSCKKSNIGNSSDPIFNIYKATANQHEGLLADVFDPSTKCKTYFYGNFNDSGVPKDVKSIVLEFSNTDTLYNYILDDNNRIYLTYGSLKNGTKLNNVVKITYPNNDSAFINLYNYNWSNNSDSLIKQISINYTTNSAVTTYGRLSQNLGGDDLSEFQNNINQIKDQNKKYLFNGLITVDGVIGGICIIGSFASFGGAGAFCAAFGVISTALILFQPQLSNAATLIPNTNPNVPNNPTSASAIIPNPIGSPNFPVGSTGRLSLYATECYSGCVGAVGVGNSLVVDVYVDINNILATTNVTIQNSSFVAVCGGSGTSTLTLPVGNYSLHVYVAGNPNGGLWGYGSAVYANDCTLVSL